MGEAGKSPGVLLVWKLRFDLRSQLWHNWCCESVLRVKVKFPDKFCAQVRFSKKRPECWSLKEKHKLHFSAWWKLCVHPASRLLRLLSAMTDRDSKCPLINLKLCEIQKGCTRQNLCAQSNGGCSPLQSWEAVSILGPWTAASGGKRLDRIIFLWRFQFEGNKNGLAFAQDQLLRIWRSCTTNEPSQKQKFKSGFKEYSASH